MKSDLPSLLAVIVLGVAAFLAPLQAYGDTMQAKGDHTLIVLHTDPCTNEKILKLGQELMAKDGHKAVVTFEGRQVEACWVSVDEENVVIIDEDGDGGYIPKNIFKRVPSV